MKNIQFTVEEENLICIYHNADRRRTMTAIADALSTALFLLPQEESGELLSGVPGAYALWVTADGKIIKSDGWGMPS